MTENLRLRRYYEALGFRHRGDIDGENPPPFTSFRPRWRTSLYEKSVACGHSSPRIGAVGDGSMTNGDDSDFALGVIELVDDAIRTDAK